MSEPTPRHELTLKPVLYDMPDPGTAVVRQDVPFTGGDGQPLAMDVYLPADAPASGIRPPAVVIVEGYPDPGFGRMLGCRFKEMASTVSWGRLMAASGLAAIACTNREPERDLHALLDHLAAHGSALGVDERTIGLWASSGNTPLALSLLMRGGPDSVRCAAFCYGYLLDLEGGHGVADAARSFHFVNPCAGRSMDDLRQDVPMFLARAGRDETPHLNDTLDRFAAAALSRNLPLTLVNHAEAPHAFDLLHDSPMTREVVRQVLGFLRFELIERSVQPG